MEQSVMTTLSQQQEALNPDSQNQHFWQPGKVSWHRIFTDQ